MNALEYQLAVVGLAGSAARGYSSDTDLVLNELRALQRLKAALKPETEELLPVEVEPPQAYRERFPDHRTFRIGEVQIIASLEEYGWHFTLSHPERYPTWEELQAAASILRDAAAMWARVPLEENPGGIASFAIHLFERPPIVS